MAEALISGLSFIEMYIVPFVYAIGIIFFLYGVLHTYVLDRPDIGHQPILNSALTFAIALILFAVVAIPLWFLTESQEAAERGEGESRRPNVGADVEQNRSVLPVPNAPGSNQ